MPLLDLNGPTNRIEPLLNDSLLSGSSAPSRRVLPVRSPDAPPRRGCTPPTCFTGPPCPRRPGAEEGLEGGPCSGNWVNSSQIHWSKVELDLIILGRTVTLYSLLHTLVLLSSPSLFTIWGRGGAWHSDLNKGEDLGAKKRGQERRDSMMYPPTPTSPARPALAFSVWSRGGLRSLPVLATWDQPSRQHT